MIAPIITSSLPCCKLILWRKKLFDADCSSVLRYHYKDPDDRGVNQARAHACEIIAWRLVLHYSRRERLDALLAELPPPKKQSDGDGQHEDGDAENGFNVDERSPLVSRSNGPRRPSDDVSFMRYFASNQIRRMRVSLLPCVHLQNLASGKTRHVCSRKSSDFRRSRRLNTTYTTRETD